MSSTRYEQHIDLTAQWVRRSISRGRGGSAGYFMPLTGWSKPYPETTGYLIPTLLELAQFRSQPEWNGRARGLGDWLLRIQRPDGAWYGGLHPPSRSAAPSIFNTGQILKGLLALNEHTGEPRWLGSAERAARWLNERLDPDRLWGAGDYRADYTPSYYSEVLAPLSEYAVAADDAEMRGRCSGALDTIVARVRPDGTFSQWGFESGKPAFTHTIAYTLYGLMVTAENLGEWKRHRAPIVAALEVLVRRAELRGGWLPGAFHGGWKAAGTYVCLTGNAQVALAILAWEEREQDLRLVSAAARLVDVVCESQMARGPGGLRGAVGGSKPLWGPYMRFRYPNWAAKYHLDALMALHKRLESLE